MLRTYCTLFDRNYLFQGIALHQSLLRHGGDFRLFALCMDDVALSMVSKMQGPTLIPVALADILTPELDDVKGRTTHGQFCWVCQPLICEYVLNLGGNDMVTYLEADSLFFSSPERLFEELGEGSVSLVPHNYSAEFDNSAVAGVFCVQFNAFKNDSRARRVLEDWRGACFRYDKSKPADYPGQTCLDDWPNRFEGVVILKNKGAGVAPWNIRGYKLVEQAGEPMVDEVPVVFYHYHQYGRLKGGAHELGSYPMTREVVDCFYVRYVEALRQAEAAVRSHDPSFSYRREYPDELGILAALKTGSLAEVRRCLQRYKRRIRGRHNVYPDDYFTRHMRGRQAS